MTRSPNCASPVVELAASVRANAATRPTATRRATGSIHQPCPSALALIALAALILGWVACGPSDPPPRYSSPALTWQTYARAVSDKDADAAWACFSPSHQGHQYEGDLSRWKSELERRGTDMKRDNKRREIVEERVLSPRLAYLLFDAGTLPSDRESPFVYFLRGPRGWKMTTHLDTVFHRELEQAIARGEYRLPDRD